MYFHTLFFFSNNRPSLYLVLWDMDIRLREATHVKMYLPYLSSESTLKGKKRKWSQGSQVANAFLLTWRDTRKKKNHKSCLPCKLTEKSANLKSPLIKWQFLFSICYFPNRLIQDIFINRWEHFTGPSSIRSAIVSLHSWQQAAILYICPP